MYMVPIKDVVKVWNETFDDLDDHDKVHVALIILVDLVFLGRQSYQYVSPEVLTIVEDLDRFSEYPWGSFVWNHTYRQIKGAFSRRNQVTNKILLSGFLLAFNVWILEMFPVSTRCFTRRDRYPRGIRWDRKVKTMQIGDVDAFFRIWKRSREPLVRLEADAFEMQ